MIDNPQLNDNRSYDYSSYKTDFRDEYFPIMEMISSNASVVDLGCGNGSLLHLLIEKKNVKGAGVEISKSGVEACKEKGLNVIEGRIDEKMPFEDDQFDFSICNVTIQMVSSPEILLSEMKRISKYQIISFPNFAFYKNRLDLLFKGRMPKPMLFGYNWYNTGHIHQLSIKDFYELIRKTGGIRVADNKFIPNKNLLADLLSKSFPNLFQYISIYKLVKVR